MSSSPCQKCGAETRSYPCSSCGWRPASRAERERDDALTKLEVVERERDNFKLAMTNSADAAKRASEKLAEATTRAENAELEAAELNKAIMESRYEAERWHERADDAEQTVAAFREGKSPGLAAEIRRRKSAQNERNHYRRDLGEAQAKLASVEELSPSDWEMIGDALADHAEKWEEAIAGGNQGPEDAHRPARAVHLISVVSRVSRSATGDNESLSGSASTGDNKSPGLEAPFVRLPDGQLAIEIVPALEMAMESGRKPKPATRRGESMMFGELIAGQRFTRPSYTGMVFMKLDGYLLSTDEDGSYQVNVIVVRGVLGAGSAIEMAAAEEVVPVFETTGENASPSGSASPEDNKSPVAGGES